MVKVSVESKTDLLDLSTSAKIASEQYRQATASAYRSFQMRTSGGGGSALDVFIAKINTLSDQVFQHYPQLLKDYATVLETYASSLETEGFSGDLIYSKKDDIDGIVNWLTNQRYNSIDEKGAALDIVFKQAATALAASPAPVELGEVTTVSIVQDAYDTLNRLGKERVSKHGNLTDALKQFKKELESIEASLMTTQSYLENAHYVGQVPASRFVGWLTTGRLNAGNMNLIDHIRGEGDDEMLHVLLNEGGNKEDFFKKLGAVDATHVSPGMMDLAYERFFAIAEPGENDRTIEKFFQALQAQDAAAVEIYMEKMVFSGDQYATSLTAKAVEKLPPFPGKNASFEQLSAYSEQWAALQSDKEFQNIHRLMTKGGVLTSLFTSAHIHQLGTDKIQKSSVTEEFTMGMSALTFDRNNQSYQWTRTRTDNWGGKEKVDITADFNAANDEIDDDDTRVKLSELEKKRQEAMNKFVTNLVALPANLVYPGAGTVIDLTTELITSDGSASSKTTVLGGLANMSIGDSYSAIEGGVGNASELIGTYEMFREIAEQRTALNSRAVSIMFDGGGYSALDDNDKGVARYDITYDLPANLALQDMNQNGLRAAVYRLHGGLTPSDDPNFKDSRKLAQEVLQYYDQFMNNDYEGQNGIYYSGNSRLNYSEMDPNKVRTEIEELLTQINSDELNQLFTDNKEFLNKMSTINDYRKNNNGDFDKLFPGGN